MLKIAICDNDVQELSRISDLLSQYKTEKKHHIKIGGLSSSALTENNLDAAKLLIGT